MGKYNKAPRRAPAPKKPPLTHFLCLPLVTEQSKAQLETSLEEFRHTVTSGAGGSPAIIHPKAVRPVGALHCTLGVMSLNTEQLAQAATFLENLDVQSLLLNVVEGNQPATAASGPLVVDLKGLESMHAPEKTSILYAAPTDPSERLYPFCLAVQKLFKDQGYLVEDDRKLKLHATLVNTIYAKGKKLPPKGGGGSSAGQPSVSTSDRAQQHDGGVQGHGPNANAPLKIDARVLLDRYEDFVWAREVGLDRLVICEMGAKKVFDSDGKVIAEQYTEVAGVALAS